MIKVNLIPVKKKKKAKPVPKFFVTAVFATVFSVIILAYLYYFFNARVNERTFQVKENDKKIAELKQKIKSVEDYEQRNATYKQRKEIIEQLSKNKTLPVKVLDEISSVLPSGVWLDSMTVNGADINLSCTGFTNTDVVNYVNNLKNSAIFTDVYLQESVQTQIANFSSYKFRITLKVKT